MRGVPGDEDSPGAIVLRDRDAQIPEADMFETARELETRGLVQQTGEIVVVARGIGRHRRVEEEALLGIDAAEELPVAVQRRIHRPIGRAHEIASCPR